MKWVYRLLRRKQMEDQLERELCFHLDEHTRDLMDRGVDPTEARRQARLALGGPEQVKEQCRDARGTLWLDNLLQDLRYAFRSLRLRPAFTAVTLCTLALGIGATTIIFTLINSVLFKPLAYPEPERLVSLHGQTEKYGDHWGVSYPDFLDYQRECRSLTPIAAWNYGGGTLSQPGASEYVEGRQISSELFSVFGIPLTRGRAFLPQEDRPGARPVIIVSYSFWQRRFAGSPAAIGIPLIFDGKSYTLVGIAPPGFQLDGEADVYTPLGQVAEPRMQNREARFLRVVARLRSAVTLGAAQTELTLIAGHLAKEYPKSNRGSNVVAYPLRQDLVGDVRSTLLLLFAAVCLVLLIVCVNVASLLLARAVSRERELAMRVALGAGRVRLVRQCLTESAVLGVLGGGLGVALAAIGFRPLIVLWPGTLPRAAEVHLDWHVLLFALGASLVCGLLFGIAPALRAPSRELDQALRAGARTVSGDSRRLHSGFVMSEIALAVVLLIAAGILARTVFRLSTLDPGINLHGVLVTRVALSPGVLDNPDQIRASWQGVQESARQVPGVRSVALSDIIPMRHMINALGYWTTPAPPPANQMPIALASCVTPDYLQVMGIPLRRGRFFDDHDGLGTELVVVIDQILAQHAFGDTDPIGRRLWIQAVGATKVVGVVGHVRHWGLADDDQSQVRDEIYYPLAQVPDPLLHLFSSFMSMAIRTSVPPLSVVEPLRRELRGVTADQTLYDVRTMEQLASESLGRQRFLMTLFGIFASLALLLACIGIYGVLAYVTSQRVPEIGLRMALGASAGVIVRMVLRQSLQMIFIGIGVGLVIAVAAVRVLERLVAGVHSADPMTFAVMIIALVIAALVASFLPARRASRIDPLSALRGE